ncbi:MAG TPA: biotin carboxylase N-terminal domain-containing protein [Steroidobacteraceae bacterium]|nr:biotin carboxylase N-terminal domain-containing protein [Steroidobacteraceae bacterium]HUK02214.1 biotin carboxylase N-terminal domain-containing protein [Steroidobacteraceae bacterium]
MILRRIAIANRGEIAVRIIRTCERLGIETVLLASEADVDSVPARLATRTVCIGPPRSADSYLNADALISAALGAHVQAVHPGYGFLSENASFARRCRQAGLVFIGPTEEQLAAVGDKLTARRHAQKAGIPVVPGAAAASAEEALTVAERIGWPVLIKAVGGGGGRGMKPVFAPAEMPQAIALATAEAASAFADSRVYLERFVQRGRHIEVQLLGDGERVVHLGDRDCSVQRRYQKLIEEAPAPDLEPRLRRAIQAAAVSFGQHLRYRGAGTVEFLVDTVRNEFYFLEMNARIQVEHPVTEEVTGLDLIGEQIAIAQDGLLAMSQTDIVLTGHALECRINAEDASRDFRPSPGTVSAARFAAGSDIRVDTHIESGARVPPFYDSLLAKLIVRAPDRGGCIERMSAALVRTQIQGVTTNLALHAALMQEREFARGAVDTAYFARLQASRGLQVPW